METRIASDTGQSCDSILIVRFIEKGAADLLKVKLKLFR